MKLKTVLKKSSSYFIGSGLSKLLSALLLPFIALKITPEIFGYFDYLQTISFVISPILFFAIWESILKYGLNKDTTYNYKVVFNTSIYIASLSALLVILFSILSIVLLKINVFDVLLVAAIIISTSTLTVTQTFLRVRQETFYYAFSGVISSIIFSSLTITFYHLGICKSYGLFISYISSQIIPLIMVSYKLSLLKELNVKFISFELLYKMIRFSLPLVLNLILIWFLIGFSKVLITSVLGIQENGLFAFASRFSTIIFMVGSVLGLALTEEAHFSVNSTSFNINFITVIKKVINSLFEVSIAAIAPIGIFYSLIEPSPFSSTLLVSYFMVGFSIFMSISTSLNSYFTAIEKTSLTYKSTLISTTLSFLLSIYSIESYGILGVSISLFLGALTLVFVRLWLLSRLNIKIIHVSQFILKLSIYLSLSFLTWLLPIYFDLIILLLSFIIVYRFLKELKTL